MEAAVLDPTPPTVVEDILSVSHGLGLKDQILKAIASAASDVRSDETNTVKRAKLVRLVAAGFEAKHPRKKIAAAIVGEDKAYAGAAARYIMQARWYLGKYRKTEVPLTEPVVVAGRRFENIVDALSANVATFTAIHNEFSAKIRPQKERKTTTPGDPKASAKVIANRLAMPMMVEGHAKRVKISENPQAFVAFFRGVMDLDIARQVLGASRVNAWKKQLAEAL